MFFLFIGTTGVFAQEKEQKVSDDELTKFVTTFDQLEAANKDAQQKMLLVVQNEGLDMKRFNEIHVAFINPNMESNATPEELEKHHRAMEKIEKMQTELQSKMDNIVKQGGLNTRKYQKIATELQSNMTLRERYKKMAVHEKG